MNNRGQKNFSIGLRKIYGGVDWFKEGELPEKFEKKGNLKFLCV